MTPSKKNIRKQIPREFKADFKSSSEGFQIPEGYFEQMQNQVVAKCNELEQKTTLLPAKKNYRIIWSAAASIALLIVAFASFTIWKQLETSKQYSLLETDTYLFAEMLEDNFLSVSDVILYDLELTYMGEDEQLIDEQYSASDGEWAESDDYEDEFDDYLFDYLMDDDFFLMDYLDGNDI